jgi:hypothetical protein
VSLAERARDRTLHIAGLVGLADGAERDVLLNEMLSSWRDFGRDRAARATPRLPPLVSMNTLVTISLVIVALAALGAILLFWLHGATR